MGTLGQTIQASNNKQIAYLPTCQNQKWDKISFGLKSYEFYENSQNYQVKGQTSAQKYNKKAGQSKGQ